MATIDLVKSIGELPTDPFWILMWDDSIQIPGDERSRTNPGHGYPASTEYFVRMKTFTDKDELKAEIETLMMPEFGERKKFKVVGATNIMIETRVELLLQT